MENDLTTLRSIQKMLEHRLKEGFESAAEDKQHAGKNGERASKNNQREIEKLRTRNLILSNSQDHLKKINEGLNEKIRLLANENDGLLE